MQRTTDIGARKSLVDELGKLDELVDPSPKVIAGRLGQFERALKGFALPFLGVNALLVGSLLYWHHDPARIVQLVFFGCLTTGWLVILLARAAKPGWIDYGGFFSLLLLTLLSAMTPLTGAVSGFAITLALAIAICARWIPEQSSIIYVAYLPWIALVAVPQTGFRVGFELTTLVSVSAVFLIRRLRLAGGVSLSAAALVGYLEFNRVGSGNAYLIALAFACLILAVWYETRQASGEQSSLRQFVGEGLIVALAWPAAIEPLGDTPTAWWTWATATALYELVQSWRERFTRPTRLCWPAVAIVLCLITQLPAAIDWSVPLIGTLVLGASLHGLARRLRTRFLSNLALVLCVGSAMAVLSQSTSAHLLSAVLNGVLVYALLMTIAFTPAEPPTIPWFQGFLHPNRVRWFRKAGLVVLAQSLRLPIIGIVFHWMRLGITWLKYVIAGERDISFSTGVFALAQAFGAFAVQNQLLASIYTKPSPEQGLLVLSEVWIPWGLLISLRGRTRNSLVYPLLGIAFISVPIIVEFSSTHSRDARTLALVAMMVGLGMWLIGAVTGRSSSGSENAASHLSNPATLSISAPKSR